MARARVQQISSFRRGPKRLTEWSILFTNAGVSVIAANSKVLVASITGAQLSGLVPGTIVRTRGTLSIGSDQKAADETQVGSIGLALVSEQARAAGVASLPSPDTDPAYDWFVYQSFAQRFFFSDATGTSPNAIFQMEIDSKAMRKFGGDQAIVLVAENTHPTDGYAMALFLRILVKDG